MSHPSRIAAKQVAWMLGLPSTTSAAAAAATPNLRASAQPTPLSSTQDLVIVEIPQPSSIVPHEKQVHFWHNCIFRYTVRAFGETVDTITPESKEEHFQHAFPGAALYVAVVVDKKHKDDDDRIDDEEADEKSLENQQPHIIGHELVDFGEMPSFEQEFAPLFEKTPHLEKEQLQRRCLFVTGICTDPIFQGKGVASALHSFAIEANSISVVALRTVNEAIIKMLRRTSPPGSLLFPNDCFEKKSEEVSERWWASAKKLANFIVPRWNHLTCEIEKYDENSLCFRGAYAPDRQKVFAKSDAEEVVVEKKKEDPRAAQPGDAVLRIAVFPF